LLRGQLCRLALGQEHAADARPQCLAQPPRGLVQETVLLPQVAGEALSSGGPGGHPPHEHVRAFPLEPFPRPVPGRDHLRTPKYWSALTDERCCETFHRFRPRRYAPVTGPRERFTKGNSCQRGGEAGTRAGVFSAGPVHTRGPPTVFALFT